MMSIVGLSLKNLSRQRKRSFLLGSAIAFGIMIITLINGTTGGFIESAGDNFAHLLAGHVFIEGWEIGTNGRSMPVLGDTDVLLRAVERIPYRSVHLRSGFMGKLIFEGVTLTLRVEGVRWEEETSLRERLALRDGSWDGVDDPRAIVISDGTAESLGAGVGDMILVQLETIAGQQNVGEFVVAAVTFDPGLLSTVSAYAAVETVNELLDLPKGGYMKMSVMLRDVRTMEQHAERLTEDLRSEGFELFPRKRPTLGLGLFDTEQPDGDWEGVRYRISTLGDYLSQLARVVDILNLLGWGILALLLVIIMVGITNTYRMIMHERTREIGTMRALGMQRADVRRLFLLEAGFLGLAGAAAGMAAAFAVMGSVSLVRFGLDTPLFLFLDGGRMRFALPPGQVVMNIGFVVILCMAGAAAPASRAAGLEPGAALRKTF